MEKKMQKILVLVLGLVGWAVPVVEGSQYLTVNGEHISPITLELGQSRTFEIVSTDSTSYAAYVGFDYGVVLGDFSHLETTPEAGNLATAIEYNQPTGFAGYYVNATGFSPPPSAGVHFVFEYTALQLGTTYVKLYDSTFTSLIDSVYITVIPLQPVPMGTAWTYQGRLIDASSDANGLYDFKFKLYDNADLMFAAQEGSTIEVNDLDVIEGEFTVELDFGSDVFGGYARWLETAVRPGDSNDPNAFVTLIPRQELTPAPYTIYSASAGNADLLDGWNSLDFAPIGHTHDNRYYTKAHVDNLENRIAQLESTVSQLTELLQGVSRQGSDIKFSGVNVQIDNGTGTTGGTVNGLGNLIVGYNELRGTGDNRTGSHNIVVGKFHNYSSYGGLVAGHYNTISGIYSSVSGGAVNIASGSYSSVSGGQRNEATQSFASVSGGESNTASGRGSSVSGGQSNDATYYYASVSGGYSNTASGRYASVSGGRNNKASGEYSFIGGGGGPNASDGSEAFGHYSVVLGGLNNIAGDPALSNHTIGQQSTVCGGQYNKASGQFALVCGGGGASTSLGNEAFALYSVVLGGYGNLAGDENRISHNVGPQSVVSGGAFNKASGSRSTISGGWANEALDEWDSVSGGRYNKAAGPYASVSGGYWNTASGLDSSVSGGQANTAMGEKSSVSGGRENEARGGKSSVSGGYNRFAAGEYDWAAGGLNQGQ